MSNADCVVRLSWEGFAALCRFLAARVTADYFPEVVVGIARGGTLPGALIALLLRRDFHALRIPSPALPDTLPAHAPPREVVADRRVLLVDEMTADGTALRSATAMLRALGAAEVRTATLFTRKAAVRADYSGPEVSVIVLQPWIQDVVLPGHPSPSRQPHDGTERVRGSPPR